ncbi:hypothetical protein AX16_005718 [Volvariella volvacea WC 439]|nr:hypothetical protein AX16_005718 [Volvariella volvacea WC 439]
MSSQVSDHAHSQDAPSIPVLSDFSQRTDSPVSQSAPSSESSGSIQVGVESPDESEWNGSHYDDDISVSGWHPRPRQQPGSDYGSGGGRSVRGVAPNQTAIPGLGNAPSILVEGKQAIEPLNNPRVIPGVPEEYMRYERNIIIPREHVDHKIKPLTTDYLNNRTHPPGWLSYIHPEGALYFFHTEKRVFTDANLFNPGTLSQVEDRLDIIYTHMEQQGISISKIGKNVDLVLDMIPVDDCAEMECYYYFVDHATRTIFYLDEVMTSHSPGWHSIRGFNSLPHFSHEIESQYWYEDQL